METAQYVLLLNGPRPPLNMIFRVSLEPSSAIGFDFFAAETHTVHLEASHGEIFWGSGSVVGVYWICQPRRHEKGGFERADQVSMVGRLILTMTCSFTLVLYNIILFRLNFTF